MMYVVVGLVVLSMLMMGYNLYVNQNRNIGLRDKLNEFMSGVVAGDEGYGKAFDKLREKNKELIEWTQTTSKALDTNHRLYIERFEKLEEYTNEIQNNSENTEFNFESVSKRFTAIGDFSNEVQKKFYELRTTDEEQKDELDKIVLWLERQLEIIDTHMVKTGPNKVRRRTPSRVRTRNLNLAMRR